MDTKKIGLRINSALATRDMKQKELAKILGVTDNTISYYCSGSRTPKLDQLIQIAESLNVTTDYLLGLTDDPEKKPAATDDLGLSEKAVKKIRYLRNCSSNDMEYMDFFSQLIESDLFDRFIYDLYMRSQVNIAEIVYNSFRTGTFDFKDSNASSDRNRKVLEIANSGKYNSVVSSYLRQMVRFDQEQHILDENGESYYDCNFGKDIVPQIVELDTLSIFEALKRDLCQTTARPIEKQLREEALRNGND